MKLEDEVKAQMRRLALLDDDLEEHITRGTGPGGQKINKTSIAVHLIHRPSGIDVRCQKTRSQALNRLYARLSLCKKLEQQIEATRAQLEQRREKARRRNRKRPTGLKVRILES